MEDAKLQAIMTLQAEQFQRGMQLLYNKVEKLQEKLEKTGNSKAFDKLGASVSKLGTTVMAIGSAIAGFKAGEYMLNQAMQAVESENLFEVSMGKMADSARKWSDATSKSLGLNAYDVRKNLGVMNVMLGSMGLNSDEAYNYSKNLTKLAYDMASFYNLNPEDAFGKIRSGMTGETEALRQLGIMVNETTTQQALQGAGIVKNTKNLTEAQKVQGRYLSIMKQTSKAQGDLARTMTSPTNQLRIFIERVQMLAISLGNTLLPAFSEIIKALLAFTEQCQSFAEKYGPQLEAVFTSMATSITSIGTALGQVDFNPMIAALNIIAWAMNAISIAANQAIMMIRSLINTVVNLGGIHDIWDINPLTRLIKYNANMFDAFKKGGIKGAIDYNYNQAKGNLGAYNKENKVIGDDWLNSFDKNWRSMQDLSVDGLINKMKKLNDQLNALKAKGKDTSSVQKAIDAVNGKLNKTKNQLSDINKLLEKNFKLAISRAWANRAKFIEEMVKAGRLPDNGPVYTGTIGGNSGTTGGNGGGSTGDPGVGSGGPTGFAGSFAVDLNALNDYFGKLNNTISQTAGAVQSTTNSFKKLQKNINLQGTTGMASTIGTAMRGFGLGKYSDKIDSVLGTVNQARGIIGQIANLPNVLGNVNSGNGAGQAVNYVFNIAGQAVTLPGVRNNNLVDDVNKLKDLFNVLVNTGNTVGTVFNP